jgi:hypothetical protein
VQIVKAVTEAMPPHLQDTFVPPNDPRLIHIGRYKVSQEVAHYGFPGVTLNFTYTGPAPVLLLGATSPFCAYNLSINEWDSVVIRLPEGPSEVTLPSGRAPAGGWKVELIRRNESWQGVACMYGLRLPAGCELLTPPRLPERRLLFVGDSMTSGERIDRMPPDFDPTPRTANAARSFGMILGRRLGTQVHLVSYGGRGLLRTWEGKTDVPQIPEIFERALPDDPSSRWDHSTYQPDAVVVCLGQNDLNPGLLEESVLVAAYSDFVSRLREVYPNAGLVLAGSPMQGEETGTAEREKRDLLEHCLKTVATTLRRPGKPPIAVARLGKKPGTGEESHPVAFQHEQIAEELLGPLLQATGW